MLNSIPYTVDHGLSGQTVKPADTYTRWRDGKCYAFILVNGMVFKHPEGFDTEQQAREFLARTEAEGATID